LFVLFKCFTRRCDGGFFFYLPLFQSE
jgi:hypothetical protein